MTEIDCEIGGSKRCSAASLGFFPDQSGRNVRQELFRCETCGHGVTMPPLDDTSSLYKERTTQDFQPNTNGISWRIKEIAFDIQARRLLRQLGNKPRTLLDYGCGSGQFTRVLGNLLPDTKVTGSDFFDTPPRELLSNRYMSLKELEESGERFDVVLALHVLEHDNSPHELMQRLMRLVHNDGRLVIEVPNIECPWGRILGKQWDVWYTPFHRHHFSPASLLAIANNEGLTVESIKGVTVPSMGRSLANLLHLPKGVLCLLAGMVLHPIQLLGEFVSGQHTAIRVVLLKRKNDPIKLVAEQHLAESTLIGRTMSASE